MDNRWDIKGYNNSPYYNSSKQKKNEYEEVKEEYEEKNLNSDLDSGVYTLEQLENNLFNDGFGDYIDGIRLFTSKDLDNGKLCIVPVIDVDKTIFGISEGSLDDEEVKLSRRISGNAKEVRPLFVIDGAINRSKDLDYLFYKLNKGMKLQSIEELTEVELNELGLEINKFYVSSITSDDIQILGGNEIKDLIDVKLKKFNSTDKNNEELKELVKATENKESYVAYIPLLDKVVGVY